MRWCASTGSCLLATAFLFRKPSGFSIVYHKTLAFSNEQTQRHSRRNSNTIPFWAVPVSPGNSRVCREANAETQPLKFKYYSISGCVEYTTKYRAEANHCLRPFYNRPIASRISSSPPIQERSDGHLSASRFPAACPAKTARIPRKNATAAASSGPTRETPAPIPAARLSRDNATAREAASPPPTGIERHPDPPPEGPRTRSG